MPCIRKNDEGRCGKFQAPYWCTGPKGGRKSISAKRETVRQLPKFCAANASGTASCRWTGSSSGRRSGLGPVRRRHRRAERLKRSGVADLPQIGPSQPLLPVFLQLGFGFIEGRRNAGDPHHFGSCALHAIDGPKPLVRFARSVPFVNAPDLQFAVHHEMIGFSPCRRTIGIRTKGERHIGTWRTTKGYIGR
jgi:hypothetical protein